MTRSLDVWMNGELVGRWIVSAGTPAFQYADEWLASERVRGLSRSLPILPGNQPHRGEVVASWFDNLLPDSRAIRERVAGRFRTGSASAFDLLAAIGRDCVGAVQIMPGGSDASNVHSIDASPIDDAGVAAMLRGVTAESVFGQLDVAPLFRISIAGAQEKTALLRLNGAWHVPHGATPTTHILKLPLGLVGNMRYDMHHSVENEWLCMQLLGELGLPVAHTEIATFADDLGSQKVLVVERFDRQMMRASDGNAHDWLVRLPQEDMCQAFGLSSDAKYESDGGPGVERITDLLRSGANAEGDVLTFAKSQLAFWLLAAIDGHAKNFSLFLRRDGYVLTPLYDVLSAWPIIGRGAGELAEQKATLAMALRGERRPRRHIARISTRHWIGLARQTRVPYAMDAFVELVRGVDGALDRTEQRLPPDFPVHVWTAIARGVRRHRDRFLRGLEKPEVHAGEMSPA